MKKDMKKKLLFTPIDQFSHGGGSTFLSTLLPHLDCNTTWDIADEWDVALMMGAETPLDIIDSIVTERKSKGAKILYRLDGIKHTRMPEGIERMQAMFEIADTVIYQSKFVKAEAESLWGEHENSRIIYNGVDLEKFKPRKPNDYYSRPHSFLYCEFSHKLHKRAQEAFGLMQKIIKKYPNTKLTIIGKFPQDWINQKFGLPQENVKFLGRLSHNTMPHILNSHKILLFPSVDEPCSNLILEAMASKVLIVHKDSGCMTELCGDTQIDWDWYLSCFNPTHIPSPEYINKLKNEFDEETKKAYIEGKFTPHDYHAGRLRVHKYFSNHEMVKKYMEALGDGISGHIEEG